MSLARTKPAYDYSTYDTRALTHEGCIVDAGCAGFDMFDSLKGEKRIIGIDPFEQPKEGYEFFGGVLAPFTGECAICQSGDESSLVTGHKTVMVQAASWKAFCRAYEVDKVSILKLNIEGAEYALLNSLDTNDFAKIDQIMVSFHDWLYPEWRHLTKASDYLLRENGFKLEHTASQYGWRLYIKQK